MADRLSGSTTVPLPITFSRSVPWAMVMVEAASRNMKATMGEKRSASHT